MKKRRETRKVGSWQSQSAIIALSQERAYTSHFEGGTTEKSFNKRKKCKIDLSLVPACGRQGGDKVKFLIIRTIFFTHKKVRK